MGYEKIVADSLGNAIVNAQIDHADYYHAVFAEQRNFFLPYIANKFDVDECPICLEKFKEENIVMQLHCQHVFHTNCFQLWLSQSSTCPYCRMKLSDKMTKFYNFDSIVDAAGVIHVTIYLETDHNLYGE
ncbi:hypothetical protein HELRODRAFT_72663 [Helobdella robusta]|uniref:RING-type domain-containing protein n=1 Tax=Helobdella robusta TaxID=6412 RepID=T1G136_HELRO|nr:hypothetical protein HELRODRAFT_72663 [Helobdella robusta]ESO10761.1 hypothetical protein HELRODRAFT_72663 [Helobdella robusta]